MAQGTASIREPEEPRAVNGIPVDDFGARLALVRRVMNWNAKEAADACGITPTSWRNWEDGGPCQRLSRVCHAISDRTGLSYSWLMLGGPLVVVSTGSRFRGLSLLAGQDGEQGELSLGDYGTPRAVDALAG